MGKIGTKERDAVDTGMEVKNRVQRKRAREEGDLGQGLEGCGTREC